MKKIVCLLAFFLHTSFAYGISELTPFDYLNNSGGLNTTAAPTSVADNESPDLQNVDFNEFGAIKKRKGYATLNTTPLTGETELTGLYQYRLNDGTSKLVCPHSTAFYKMDTDSSGVPDGTPDDITSGETITAEEKFSFDTIRNTLVATNGTDLPFKWDAVNSPNDIAQLGVPAGLTKAKYVVGFKDRTILANVTVSGVDYPSRFYYSDIGTLDTFSATSFISVQTDDGGQIRGIIVLGERLVILKDFGIYNILFTGDADVPFIVRKSNSDVGCISHWSIAKVKNNIVFLSPDGIYIYNGTESMKISDKIETTLEEFQTADYTKTSSANYRLLNQCWFTFTSAAGTHSDRVIVWDYSNNAFGLHVGMEPAVITTFYDGNNLERLYHADYYGYIYQNNTGNSDYLKNVQTAIDAYYITKWFTFNMPSHSKTVPHVFLYLDEEGDWDLSFSYTFNFQAGDWVTQSVSLFDDGGIVGVAIVGVDIVGGKDGIIERVDLRGQGQVIRMKFSNSNIDEPFVVNGFSPLARIQAIGTP